MRKPILLFLFLTAFAALGLAQPANDECAGAIELPDVTAFCSNTAAYTNVAATPGNLSAAGCFGAVQRDVWFRFTAVATDITVTVRGATSAAAGGTLDDPQVALYFGTCTDISEVECGSAVGNDNIVEIYQSGLFVGETYFLRIQGRAGETGTFQICLNNYNPPVEPTSDCPQASVLCDKSAFTVQSVVGAGNNNLEMEDATCFSNGVPGINEMNSTWFVWTCSQSGTLEFALSPLNLPDDLDFVLYRLPNGIGNCQGKQIVRCMASGNPENLYPSPCHGPTGLRAGETDISEDAGCADAGDNTWLAPFNMVAGESYALVVNNFTSTGTGFNVEFGGTGEFLGPEAKFTTSPPAVCLGIPVTVIDASTFPLGNITSWKWSFGSTSVPQTATGPGPHVVQFNTPGVRSVLMTLETDLGCRVSDIQTVTIFPPVEIDTLIAAPDCNGTTNGAVTINNITSGTPPYEFSWNNGPFSSNNTLQNLGVGLVTLEIKDANNCRSEFDIQVEERKLTADATIDKPLCFGDANGVITLNVTNGKPPVQFDWGSGLEPNSSKGGFAAGIYTIQGVDNTLCKGTFTVTVTDNPPVTTTATAQDITCFNANDGMGTAFPVGGVGNFTYLWSDGQSSVKANNLAAGMYTVTVSDGNDCTATASISVFNPSELDISVLDTVNLRCAGLPEGEIQVAATGGRPLYEYAANQGIFRPADRLTGLPAGDFWVKVRDQSGCIDSVFVRLVQPPPLLIDAIPADTTVDLGFPVQVFSTVVPVGRQVDYLWTPATGLSGTDIPNPLITATVSQRYLVQVTDLDGCVAYDTVTVNVKRERPVYVPNVFTPDGSYPNNAFTLFSGPAAQQIELLRIYDRWGSLIFETQNIDLNKPELGWDGRYKGRDMAGVFTFYASVRFVDESTADFEGSITVVR